MRILLLLSLLLTPTLAGDEIEARLAKLEKRVDAIDKRLAKIEKMLAEAFAAQNYAANKVEDMNDMRNLVGLLVVGGKYPLAKDGRLDIYFLVRNRDIEENNFHIFESSRFGYGPTKAQIKAGDYSRFPYERYPGKVAPGKSVPLLWDKQPDLKGGRVIGFNGGAVKYYSEARFKAMMQKLFPNPPK